MPRLLRTDAAEEDLLAIWSYLVRRNEPAADRLIQEIDALFVRLSESPRMGMARPELLQTVRSFPMRRYMIFYRPISGGVEILRVVHAARDLASLSLTPDPD